MRRKTGKVYLVGAGPGDLNLLTLKGKKCLKTGEVVIYDSLVNPEILKWTKRHAMKLDGGKTRNHKTKQTQINRWMQHHARLGKTVVRLKGGDPFLFGRGGEETEYLASHRIPFEVVPGVSSLTAVPAYAGIPVTDRRYNSMLTVVTGHSKKSNAGDSQVDWKKISPKGTLVIFMGAERLKPIINRLKSLGWPPSLPVACIRMGTTPQQQVTTGTLQTIPDKFESGLLPPAVIVVGKVVALRKKIHGSGSLGDGSRRLEGKNIVVTRPRVQASDFSRSLEMHGANVLCCPTIRIIPPSTYGHLDHAIRSLNSYHWVIFTSANGVERFMQRYRMLSPKKTFPPSMKTCAIGPATADKMTTFGIAVTRISKDYVAESILKEIPTVKGTKILIPRAMEAREVLPDELKKRGADVDVVHSYRTVPDRSSIPNLRSWLKSGSVDCITFTSSSTVRNFFSLIGKAEGEKILKNKHVLSASIGPVTTQTLKKYRWPPKIKASKPTTQHLANAILKFYNHV